mmetsp:Transcript_5074/g.14826  ORF Transcript_5074/g.14826 Transcript_5074/m.14826 type:complete len:269 (+) Transcript_5074:731-1537(+)
MDSSFCRVRNSMSCSTPARESTLTSGRFATPMSSMNICLFMDLAALMTRSGTPPPNRSNRSNRRRDGRTDLSCNLMTYGGSSSSANSMAEWATGQPELAMNLDMPPNSNAVDLKSNGPTSMASSQPLPPVPLPDSDDSVEMVEYSSMLREVISMIFVLVMFMKWLMNFSKFPCTERVENPRSSITKMDCRSSNSISMRSRQSVYSSSSQISPSAYCMMRMAVHRSPYRESSNGVTPSGAGNQNTLSIENTDLRANMYLHAADTTVSRP